jgi:8-oxo-dGTP pyrophosphatase MutT (NUDIX family)
MPASKITLDEAKKDKLFYFVANVFVYREEDSRCLILRRDPREKAHPGRYGVMGGKLEWKDLDLEHPTRINGDILDFEGAVEKLLVREAREESGVEIDSESFVYLSNVAFVRPDGIPVVLMKFAAKYVSGEVVLEEGGFTEYAWVNAEEVKAYECIDGIQEEVGKVIEKFKN